MIIHVLMPHPGGRTLSEDEASELEGQWVTLLAFGESIQARVTNALPMDIAGESRLSVTAEIGTPDVEPVPTPLFLPPEE